MAGYSGTPLAKKLGYKPGIKAIIIGAPDNVVAEISSEQWSLNKGSVSSLDPDTDIIHFFSVSRQELEVALPELKKAMRDNGMVWLSWPKKASKVPTDLDGNTVRSIGLGGGLVDIKVCAVDEIWSGLKFVIPVKDRK